MFCDIRAAEEFFVKLLKEAPPIHRDDFMEISNYIPIINLDNLRENGVIRAYNGYRTLPDKSMKCDRLKSRVITDAIIGVIKWVGLHDERVTNEEIFENLQRALQCGAIPYTKAYKERQIACMPKDINVSELNSLGVQIDYYNKTCDTIYIHILDNTKDVNKCLVRHYIIKAIEARLNASAEVIIYTDSILEASSRYRQVNRKHISRLSDPYRHTSHFYGYHVFRV